VETAKGKTREEIINRLADRIDTFEKYDQPHSRLMAELAAHLARRFGLATPDVDAIAEAAMLHDIGLYAMSPAYHSLSRPLSFEARLDLWRHPIIGEQQMAKRDAIRHAQLLVRWHHEWWNGSGYPDMLAFEDIPIGARILRAVELYSALLSDRPYRAALDEPQAMAALTGSAGIECDPYVVKALLALLDELRAGIEREISPSITETAPVDSTPTPAPVSAPTENETETWSAPESQVSVEPSQTESSAELPIAFESQADAASATDEPAPPISSIGAASYEPELAAQQWTADSQEIAPVISTSAEQQSAVHTIDVRQANESIPATEPRHRETPPARPLELLLSRAHSIEIAAGDSPRWRGWCGSRYNKKTLLGFQASVLRQIEFRSIAIPFLNEARLDWYLKAWGKLIFANDPSAWAGIVARATVEAAGELAEDIISRILEDVYVPRVRLVNPDLRRWFSETDAWWMDNLRRNIDALDDELTRAQALTLGLQTGDYALSFNEETRELRRPLTTVFWQLAGRAVAGPAGHPHNRSFNQPADDFIKHARADLLYLNLPSSRAGRGGAGARSEWREAWVSGAPRAEADRATTPAILPQSRRSYLALIDRLLRPASHFKTWAVECHEPGLATAQDVVDLIKEHRPVRATYSKDVTEVAGGLRSYIIVGEGSPR
jgi:HD domain